MSRQTWAWFGMAAIALATLVSASVRVGIFGPSDGPGTLRVWFFDIGQGDATLIETPGGKQILIDGGPDDRILSKLGSVMPIWDRTIELVVPTHPDADHVTGLIPVFERYEVERVWNAGIQAHTQTNEALERAIEEEGSSRLFVSVGTRITVDGVTIDVLSPRRSAPGSFPKETNAWSVVLLVTYEDTSLLLTGDATTREEEAFLSAAGDVDVLKVGHHGSQTSTGETFLKTLKPEVAVISVGANNRYGHPHPAVLDRLERQSHVFRTDKDGDILLISTGDEPLIEPAPLPF